MLIDVFKGVPARGFRQKSKFWYEQEKNYPELDAVARLTGSIKPGTYEPYKVENLLANFYLEELKKNYDSNNRQNRTTL